MSDYPNSLDSFRAKENRPAIVYDANEKTTLFVEDLDALEGSITAIEEYVGYGDDKLPVNVSLAVNANGDDIGTLDEAVSGNTTNITNLQTQVDGLMDRIYPIGSIYTNAVDDTNPATLLNFGTWEAFGSGRVPVGFDSGDSDFNTAEETGGSKTNNLSHSHTVSSHAHAQGSHYHYTAMGFDENGHLYARGNSSARPVYGDQVVTATKRLSKTSLFSISSNSGVREARSQNVNTGNTSSSAPSTNSQLSSSTNNLQPYITVYLWKRTA